MEESVLHFDVIADHGESTSLHAQGRSGVILPVLDWTAVEPQSEAKPAALPLPASVA